MPLYVRSRDMPPLIYRLREALDRWEVLAKLKQQSPADEQARKEEAAAYVDLVSAAQGFLGR